MKKYIVPLMVGLLLAIGGAAGSNILDPLMQQNSTDNNHISSNNYNTVQIATVNTTSSNNSSINQSNSSTSDQNTTEIINNSQKVPSYGDINSKTQDTFI